MAGQTLASERFLVPQGMNGQPCTIEDLCIFKAWLGRLSHHEGSLYPHDIVGQAFTPWGVFVFLGCGWAGSHIMEGLCILRACLGKLL